MDLMKSSSHVAGEHLKPSGKTLQKHQSSIWKVALQRGNSFGGFGPLVEKPPFNSPGEKQEKYSWLLLEQSGNAC